MARSLASKIEAANLALIAQRSLEAIPEFFTRDYVAHGTGQEMAGHGAIRRFLGLYRRAFPDLQVEVEILVEAKDRVAWQRTLRATHKGGFKGFNQSSVSVIIRETDPRAQTHGA